MCHCFFFAYVIIGLLSLDNCAISCDSCPEPLDLSDDEEDLLDAVAEYGKPQKVEVGTRI